VHVVKSELIARQSRLPSGWLGEIVARVMSIETAAANRSAVARLAPALGEEILEVGCGHGRTLREILARGAGRVAGVDPSDVMVSMTARRLRREIERGRAVVQRGEAADMPFEDARFDAALAVHVLYFWPQPEDELREIRRVLRPGGRLILGFRPRDELSMAAVPASVYTLRTVEEVAELLTQAGFESLHTELEPRAIPPMAWVRALAPAS
jgi:ubiquinone/menaquinone biosynthesis C-methylase UbiE